MNSITIAELESDVRGYLKKVRQGEEVLIKVRNQPVAKIVLLTKADELTEAELEEHMQKLAAQGRLRLPEIEPDDEFWEKFWAEYATSDNEPCVSSE
ncbi:MAG: type II toxin-antitoxin system prevent-host-death family antitoxin [Acidobacteria bacterium]|nr:type II toxin-antitoxin system prevent-host-death family antitoxin [Acidobacteriota bacterium]